MNQTRRGFLSCLAGLAAAAAVSALPRPKPRAVWKTYVVAEIGIDKKRFENSPFLVAVLPTNYNCRCKLIAVGMDWDGKYKPIESLTYRV